MNEHIQKGNDALARRDLKTARAEFSLALSASDSLTQRIAKNRLRDLEDEPVPLRMTGWEEQRRADFTGHQIAMLWCQSGLC